MTDTIKVVWEIYDCSDQSISPETIGGYEYFDNMKDAVSFVDQFCSNNDEGNSHDVWYSAMIVD